jgi:sulfate permease, SulP family
VKSIRYIKQALGQVAPWVFPFLQWWPNVNKKTLKADAIAGLTGGIIVLPQGVAFAMIAGLPPIYGLYTAMVTPVIAALFGSSWHLISGPTTTISLVVFASLKGLAVPGSPEYIDMVLVLTFLAGAFQLGMGLARFGSLVNFVSHSVVIAFTAGAALLIMSSQLKYILGLTMPHGLSFQDTLVFLVKNFTTFNPWVLLVALITLVVALTIKRFWPRFPNLLSGMIVASTAAYFIGASDKGIALIGEMQGGFPPFRIPKLSMDNMDQLGSSALAIALLGLLEAVAIGRAIAVKTGQKIDANQEFIGQGLSNVVGSFFSAFAGTGSFTRSGVNHVSGAQTPISAIFAALILFVIVLFVGPLAAYLPIATMGAVILIVAYNLVDFKEIKRIILCSKSETTVLIATLSGTLFFDLEFAIFIGVFLSLFFYLRRTSKPHIALMAPNQGDSRHHFINIVRDTEVKECPQLHIVRIDGSLFFGAIDHIDSFFVDLREHEAKHVLLLAEGINFVDLAGAEWLANESVRWRKRGGDLYIANLKIIAQDILQRSGIKDSIGQDHFFSNKKEALAFIYGRLDKDICRACKNRIFWECKSDPTINEGIEGVAKSATQSVH